MIQRLPMALAHMKGSNIYDTLLNEISQVINALQRPNAII